MHLVPLKWRRKLVAILLESSERMVVAQSWWSILPLARYMLSD